MVTDNKSLNEIPFDALNWDVPVNENTDWIDIALGSSSSISVTGVTATPVTLTIAQYRPKAIIFTGTLSANVPYRRPSGVGGEWVILNNATGAFTLTLDSAAGGATAVIPQGVAVQVYANGTSGVGVVQMAALPSDPKLQAIAGLDTLPGGLYQTGPSTFTKRTLTGTTDQITVTNGDGASGDPTVAAVIASLVDVQTGTDNIKLMTSLLTREAVNYLLQTPWVVVSPSSAPTYTANLTSTNRTVRFFFSNVRNTSFLAAILRVRVSDDGGSTWSPYINISQSANWSIDGIWGEIEFWKQKKSTGLPNYVGGLSSVTNSAVGYVAVTNFPDETSASLAFNRVEFSWTTGNLNGGNIGLCTIRQLET